MKRIRLGALLATAAVVIFGAFVSTTAAPPSTFDGTPATPQAFTQLGQTEWDVQVHSRDSSSWFTLPSINAQHGSNCSAPPASHVNTSYEGSVFICANHLMTSINGSAGYAAIYLTPNRLVDITNGAVIEFDLSTEQMSQRDWWDVTLSPFLDAQALPLKSDLSFGVDLQEPNRNSIVIATDNGQASPSLAVIRNGSGTNYGHSFTPFNSGVTAANQAATRQTFRLTVTPTSIRFERLASSTATGLVFIDETIPALSWTEGVLQLGHHSYTPTKDGAGVPATWHWDEVSLNPSTDFTMIKADRRYTQGGTVNFQSPAPADAYLRFAAICKPVVDGVALTKQTDSGHPEHMSSYFVPIAAGKTSINVAFADDSWYTTGFGCIAKDFAIWSQSAASPTATPIPNTAMPTVAPPTLTPIATATNTPTSTPTATATSTPIPPTPTATATPEPTPQACRAQVRNGFFWSTVYTGTMVDGECRR